MLNVYNANIPQKLGFVVLFKNYPNFNNFNIIYVIKP